MKWLRQKGTSQQVAAFVIITTLILTFWYLITFWGRYPSYFLPGPGKVFSKALSVTLDGTLWRHTRITMLEVLGGLAVGVTLAMIVGYFLGRWEWAERILSPFIVAAQSVPVVAIAPLLVIWFGFGITSKIVVCAMIVFFPMMVSTMVSLRSVPSELLDLMRVLRASRWQILTKLEIPAALPVLFGGLRLAVTMAVVGAVVGEFVGADRGLGFLVNMGKGIFDTPLMFVALGMLMLVATGLYFLVLTLERRLLSWRY